MCTFLLSSVAIYNLAAFLIRKRLAFHEMYATITFGLFVCVLVDTYANFEYIKWGYFDKDRAEIAALWIILGIYPACTILIINYYPYASRWWVKILYLLATAVYSTWYEWLTLKLGIIWHANGWNLWWSFMTYPPLYYMLILQLRVYRWFIAHYNKRESPHGLP